MWGMNPSASSPREQAAEKLRLRAERLRAIRRRVWVTSLATFAIAFGVICVSGSMGNQTTTIAQGSSASSGDTGTTSSSGDTDTTSSSSSDDTGTTSSSSSSSSDQGSSSSSDQGSSS